MKTIASLAFLTFAVSPAFASFHLRPVTKDLQRHVWFCTADGVDYNEALRQISGGLKGSQLEAAQDAVGACRAFYTNCQVASCFQEQ